MNKKIFHPREVEAATVKINSGTKIGTGFFVS